MVLPVRIRKLALHFVDRANSVRNLSENEEDIAALGEEITGKLEHLLGEVWSAPEKSGITSASFSRDQNPVVQNAVGLILEDDDQFLAQSRRLASHLYAVSPTTSSAGLFAVFLLEEPENPDIRFVGVLKIHRDSSRKLFHQENRLRISDIPNLLIEKIQKGALFGHPQKPDFDLKLIDRQTEEPAQYFRVGFLGCEEKVADLEQTAKLLKEIRGFAISRNLRVREDRMPDFIAGLLSENRNIVTAFVERKLREHQVITGEYTDQDFEDHLSRKGGIGPINIPRPAFELVGKRLLPRHITFKFRDQRYRGVVITAPREIVEQFFSSNGDRVEFRFSTTPQGFDVEW